MRVPSRKIRCGGAYRSIRKLIDVRMINWEVLILSAFWKVREINVFAIFGQYNVAGRVEFGLEYVMLAQF